jgi:CRP-like cAMP-binding protein/glyoxylase-like metal-dependent hydrolase (beta-lactamase superfamily II)
MHNESRTGRMELIKLCPGCYLLRVQELGVSWLFNAWPDAAKFVIQRGLKLNGIVYPDLRFQGSKDTSCNLVEFPLLHALFNEGMLFGADKPRLLGTQRQLVLASESFRRGMFGFYSAEEMSDCDLTEDECRQLLREIEGLSPTGRLQETKELLDLVTLAPLEDSPTAATATEVAGLRIWKKALNVFGVGYGGEEMLIDCNLGEGEDYAPPLELDVKQFSYKLFQIVDTGEEDGFSPKSCMHTVIQWRDRIICVDLPMNVSYLLDQVSISRSEIDAVIFTHNHDDHIGELSMLLQMDKKVTVICPRVIWRSILLKAAAMLGMGIEELSGYFDYVPIRYGEEYDYAGLRILAHPSIHSVPCAVYRVRGIVGQEWKSYGHMSDILNFKRCGELIERGIITRERFQQYRDFLLEPTTVKKIDVGATEGTEQLSVHGFWKDFEQDSSDHIVLGHIRKERLDERATVTVGQVAVAGSAREVGIQSDQAYRDKYRERALTFLADYMFALVDARIAAGLVGRQQLISYVHILADCEILVIQPNTPFLKMGGDSTFVDMVISGKGSVWAQQGQDWLRVADVNAGDLIGDMGVLLQVPRTASVRSDTYMRVLRMPGFLFREIAMLLGVFSDTGEAESVLHKTWRHRELLQQNRLLSAQVPIYLQNKIAQHAHELEVRAGSAVQTAHRDALVVGADSAAFGLEIDHVALPDEAMGPAVFGERRFLKGEADPYEAIAREDVGVLALPRESFDWLREVPLFRMRLTELSERREILSRLASRPG